MTNKNVHTAIIAENFLQRLRYALVFFGFIPIMLLFGQVGMHWQNVSFEEVEKKEGSL